MATPRPMPTDQTWINRELTDLRRMIDEIRNAIRLEAATIADGGLTVDGGFVKVLDLNGVTQFLFGPISPNLDDGTPQRGWIVRRADATIVLALFDASPGDGGPATYRQALNWFDRAGNVVMADDTDGGVGLARPYLPWTFTNDGDNRTTTSGAFVTLHTFAGYRQHPRMTIGLSAFASDGSTAGEVQIVSGVDVLAGPTTIPTGGSIAPEYTFTLPAGSHMQLDYIDIQARRTAGSGDITVRPFYQHGTQT